VSSLQAETYDRVLTLKPYLRKRAALIDLEKVIPVKHGNPINSSDTIYISTSDSEGNACSFIASNYAGTSMSYGTDLEKELNPKASEQVRFPKDVDSHSKIGVVDSH
jgi:gamma-glutamyltranspeptidase